MLSKDAYRELVGEEDDFDLGEAFHAWLIVDAFQRAHEDPIPERKVRNPILRWIIGRRFERWHRDLKIFEEGWRAALSTLERLGHGK